MKYEQQVHSIEPVWDHHSNILILGSFPSVKSRETSFFYGHPQNRFWRILATLWNETLPQTIEEKKKFLLSHHIALWDVVQSCNIVGSQDSSIHQVVPNPIEQILNEASITQIFTNGTKAYTLYQRFLLPKLNRTAILLPSTSPANAACSFEKLLEKWQLIRRPFECVQA